jgi:hypothetical protein
MKVKPLSDYPKIVSTVADLKYNRGGVYFIYNPDGVLQYIGESAKVAQRIRHHDHFRYADILNWRVEVIRAYLPWTRRPLEYWSIIRLKPPMNKTHLVKRRPVDEIFPD